MPTYAIIENTIRSIRAVTVDPDSRTLSFESLVEVPSGFSISGGPWKLDVDNATKIALTVQDIAALKDIYDPSRVLARDLKAKTVTLLASAQVPDVFKQWLLSLRAFMIDKLDTD